MSAEHQRISINGDLNVDEGKRISINGNLDESIRASINDDVDEGAQVVSESSPLLHGMRGALEARAVVGEQKRRLMLISVVSLVLAIAGSLHRPVIIQYVYQVNTKEVYGFQNVTIDITIQPCVNTSDNASSDTALRDQVQRKSADFTMKLDIVSNIISVVANMFIGSYSDVLGRKMVLLLPIIGHFLRNVTVPIIIFWDLGLNALYSGCIIDGLLGSSFGIILGCYLYAADITTGEKQRTMGLALVEASMGIGIAATQVAIGLFIAKTGFFYPSLTACLLELLCVIIVVVWLPETVPRDRKRFISPLDSIKRIASTFWSRDNPHQRCILLLCLLAFLVGITAGTGVSKIFSLYIMNEPFCWGSFKSGVFGSVSDSSGHLGSLLLLTLLQKVLSSPFISIFGAVSEIAKDIVLGLASNDLMIYMSCVVGIGKSMLWSPIRSLVSRMVPPDQRGSLFAGIALVESLCATVSVPAFVSMYKYFLNTKPGNTFFIMTGFYSIVILIFLKCMHVLRKYKLDAVKSANVHNSAIVT